MHGCKISTFLKAAIIIIFVFWMTIPEIPANEVQIDVLVSHNESPYTEVLTGFQNYIVEQKIQMKCSTYILENKKAPISQISLEIKKNKPGLIFTVGTIPTVEALKVFDDVPIVASLILDENTMKRARNSTGVILDFPIEAQFFWLKSFLPEAKKIGVMYNPLENQEKIRRAGEIARKMGLELNPVKVHTPKDIPNALKSLANNADVLWGINDALVFNSLTARHILLFSFRNRIQFCGLSSAWVEAGALYALEYDFYDIGVQCGEKAVKIIRGAGVNSVPVSLPRKLLYTLNLKTARHMKIDIQEEHIRNAYKIFEE
ncbi:MAG: hypothetical protein HBSIN01_07040 [Candidatus Brocadia sinica]|nr:hypothetical protein [Candidatus Brocadia sp. AMX1]NOG42670.1 hypothetical protein [Planctomycetota bacterium]GJQ16745.1 MAG: hypothetical protein HBSIN01_07040 [Candidatus Brocadia sinica]